MNEDLPLPFGQTPRRRAPAELRGRVLGAINQELARRKGLRWERLVELAVAATFVLGVGLNVWQQRGDQAWQTRVFGPLAVPRDISDVAGAVASVTDAQTARQVREVLSASRLRRPAGPAQSAQYQRFLRELSNQDMGAKL